jgi:hypothetical protein
MEDRMRAPAHLTAYDRVVRAAASGTVYISRSTSLDGERKTVSWHLAKKMEMDGTVKRANSSPDFLILTGGRHYLENVYHEHLVKGKRNDGTPDSKADALVHVLKKLGLKSAQFVSGRQVVGLSLEDWDRLPGMIPRKRR